MGFYAFLEEKMILNNNFVNNKESIKEEKMWQNISNIGKTLSAMVLIVIFMVFGTTCFAVDFETNNILKQTVDVTNSTTESIASTHNCNANPLDAYNSNGHCQKLSQN